jgi:tripartite-type tricarboxylate transporter receptor subunit TctC
MFMLARTVLCAAGVLCCASAAEAAEFYEGKTLHVIVGGSAGSGYDHYARTLAEFLPKHIPGRPTAVVENMPGANGGVSAAHMFNKAPRDGTVIAAAISVTPTLPLLRPNVAKFDSTKFSWIGSITKDIYVAYVLKDAPVSTYEELKKTPVVMGGVGIGAASVSLAVMSNALFGTKMKIVQGYESETRIQLAVERGEVQGSFGGVYSSLKSLRSEWLGDGRIKLIMQHGLTRLPELPDTPLFIDQAKTPEERQMLRFLLAPQEFNKPYYAPPGVPADRLAILRQAFDATVRDPGFLAAAARAHLATEGPMNGEELARAVAEVARTPPPLVERVKAILASFKQ